MAEKLNEHNLQMDRKFAWVTPTWCITKRGKAMHKKIVRILLSLSLLPFLTAWPSLTVSAQNEAQVRITQVDNSNFPNVTVYVSVTNADGEPMAIDPATIQISENGQPMQPTDIRGGGKNGEGMAEPLTTMLVLDISGSMEKGNKFAAAKEAAKTYVSQMRPGDQAGLITFDSQVHHVQPVTTDVALLIQKIDQLKTGSDTAMYNALIEAEKELQGVQGRKAIIVLTDGLDNQSQSSADDVITAIGPSGMTISTIGFGDASTASQAGLDEASLRGLAEKSGGLYSYAADSESLSALYQQYGRTLQSEYAITYVSPSALRDGINRNLSVSISEASATTALYNPGGVLPEVSGTSWVLFGSILAGLLLLLVIPWVISGIGSRGGGGSKSKGGRIKLANSAPGGSTSSSTTARKPNIKIK
jgi:VWFA-related protein